MRRTLCAETNPSIYPEIVELLLQMARGNPTGGNGRIQGAFANLGHEISDTAIGLHKIDLSLIEFPQLPVFSDFSFQFGWD
jgi:hypothetical protein